MMSGKGLTKEIVLLFSQYFGVPAAQEVITIPPFTSLPITDL